VVSLPWLVCSIDLLGRKDACGSAIGADLHDIVLPNRHQREHFQPFFDIGRQRLRISVHAEQTHLCKSQHTYVVVVERNSMLSRLCTIFGLMLRAEVWRRYPRHRYASVNSLPHQLAPRVNRRGGGKAKQSLFDRVSALAQMIAADTIPVGVGM
jgi:hypothetical protein